MYKLPAKLKSEIDKSKLIIFVILIMLAVFGLIIIPKLIKEKQNTRSRATTDAVDLILSAGKTTVAPGEQFEVAVSVISGDLKISAVALKLSYNAEYLNIIATRSGTFLPVSLPKRADGSLVFGSGPTENPPGGAGIVVTWTFQALKQSAEILNIGFSRAEVATIDRDDNAVGNITPVGINILSPSITPLITFTPTPSPINPTITSANTPSITPTLTPAPSTSPTPTVVPQCEIATGCSLNYQGYWFSVRPRNYPLCTVVAPWPLWFGEDPAGVYCPDFGNGDDYCRDDGREHGCINPSPTTKVRKPLR